MRKANTHQVMMIRPVQFRFNDETAGNNAFQVQPKEQEKAQDIALKEFDNLVNLLQENSVDVLVISDTPEPDTPDSIFPNNWISTHEDGTIVLYPMFAENRRAEVRQDIVDQLSEQFGYKEVVDWTAFAENERFLEGTGSIVLDRKNKVAYACISERTEQELLEEWGDSMDYEIVAFKSVDKNGFPIYHTNVMMAIAENYAVVCFESIPSEEDKKHVRLALEKENKQIVSISLEQMNNFAGNMIELKNKSGEHLLVMSQAAFNSLLPEQVNQLKQQAKLIVAPTPTIEKNGGGSVRCMIAEVYLPTK